MMSEQQSEKHFQFYSRLPNWVLFLISSLSILLSPVSFSGNFTLYQYLYQSGWSGLNANFLIYTEILFLITGLIPFLILLRRKKYGYVTLLALLGFLDVGILLISGILLQLSDPGL